MSFSLEQMLQLFALACSKPEVYGQPISHWSARELADEALKQGLVPLRGIKNAKLKIKNAYPVSFSQISDGRRIPTSTRRVRACQANFLPMNKYISDGKGLHENPNGFTQTLRIVNCIKSHFGRSKINLTLAFIARCRDEVKYQQQTGWR